MQFPGLRVVFLCAAVLCAVPSNAATPDFTIAATNVTMPGNGNPGTSRFTLVSVDGYSGRLLVNSEFIGNEMNAKPPNCGVRTAPLYTLSANQAVQGTLTCYPYGKVVPVVKLERRLSWRHTGPILALALASFILFRRRTRATAAHWFALFVLSIITMMAVASCAGNGVSGTYPFTVTATDAVTQATVSTSITVTVP